MILTSLENHHSAVTETTRRLQVVVTKKLLQEYTLSFKSCMLDSVINDMFASFLAKEKLANAFQCFTSVREFQNALREQKFANLDQFTEKAVSIRDVFLLQRSRCSINLTDTIRDSILEQIDMLEDPGVAFHEKRQVYGTLFTRLYALLKIKLRDDSFVRFQRSDKLVKYLCTKKVQYLASISKKINVDRTRVVRISGLDLVEPYLTRKEFRFARQLLQDGHDWKIMKQSKKGLHSAYYSNKPYFQGNRDANGFILTKLMFKVPHDAAHIFHTLNDPNVNVSSDDSLYEQYSLEIIPPDENCPVWCNVGVNKYNLGAFFKTRSLVFSGTAWYEEDTDTFYIVYKNCRHPKHPENSKEISMQIIGLRVMQRIGQNETLFTEVSWSNVGGFVKNSKLMPLLARNRAKELRRLVTKSIKEAEEWQKFGYVLRDNGMERVFKGNMSLTSLIKFKDF